MGRAERRKALHSGYGVHVSFIGHDMHGLKFGPDGKLYYSIGDRGFHVEHEGKTFDYPDTGAVLRCNPDGSELEVVHYGLRNPQELAFDEYGNLFTGDNNSDGGDKARWVHVVEGGDSGWRIGYQYLNTPHRRGPWNAEKLWYPAPEGDAAYILPPLANFADGPSGLTYYPGTGLSEKYRGCFFLCDFRGASGMSGVRSLRLKPNGATFEVVDTQQPIWSVLATDIDFGPDGALYLADWVDGWDKTGKGRIYRIFDPKTAGSPELAEVKRLLTAPMEKRSIDELIQLLSHADMRVRQAAQFALAERKEAAIPALEALAASSDNQLARIHAIWGLGQIGRTVPDAYKQLPELTTDKDAEIRAQSAKVLGDAPIAATPKLIALLKDPEPRPQFFAAIALGKRQKSPDAIGPLLEVLRENADRDRYLRHAAVMGLVGCANADELKASMVDASPAVRMGVLLAMRRLKLPDVYPFVLDGEPSIKLEAARAIYDEPLPALEALAGLLELASGPLSEPVMLRVIAAGYLTGGGDDAVRLAKIAQNTALSESIRLEAVKALADWNTDVTLDRFLGCWRPRPALDPQPAAAALEPRLQSLFSDPSEKIRQTTADACGRLNVAAAGPGLAALFSDSGRPSETRVAALTALGKISSPELDSAVGRAVEDKDAAVRTEGLRLLAKISPATALPVMRHVLETGTAGEKQGVFTSLGEMSGEEVEQLVALWLGHLVAGKVESAVQLDLLDAASLHKTAAIQELMAKFEATRQSDDPLAAFREALEGGDSARGRTIFFERTAASCLRCHKVGTRGGEVGPDLSHAAKDKTREYLLEALVLPNRKIAEGFETVVVATTDGRPLTGVLKGEDDLELRLMTPEAVLVVIPKDQIDERARGISAMPEDVMKHLTKRELRDLVEFLAEQE